MNNIMLDIETLGIKPGCVVLSIGAVEFDDTTGELGKSFEVIIDAASAVSYGLKIEPKTVMWWMEQNEQARALVTSGTTEMGEAIESFITAFDWKGKKVWANGAAFDFPILEAAINTTIYEAPWKYWDAMCFRTLKNLVPRRVFDTVKVEPTIAHSALADAIAQAETAIKLRKHLRGEA